MLMLMAEWSQLVKTRAVRGTTNTHTHSERESHYCKDNTILAGHCDGFGGQQGREREKTGQLADLINCLTAADDVNANDTAARCIRKILKKKITKINEVTRGKCSRQVICVCVCVCICAESRLSGLAGRTVSPSTGDTDDRGDLSRHWR